MKLNTVTAALCGALVAAGWMMLPAAAKDNEGAGPPGEQEVLLVDVSCEGFGGPFPGAGEFKDVRVRFAGSGTVTGGGGEIAVGTGTEDSCLEALAGFPEVLRGAGCTTSELGGEESSASFNGVCEGRRAAVIGAIAALSRALLTL